MRLAGRKPKGYSTVQLGEAVQRVRSGDMSLRKAAAYYGIPKTTLQGKVAGYSAVAARKGPRTVLTTSEETLVKEWVEQMARCGFPLQRANLLDVVQRIVKNDNLETPFVNGRPGKKWFASFMDRHRSLTIKKAEPISKGRAAFSEERIRGWFGTLQKVLADEGSLDVLDCPERSFNADESGFLFHKTTYSYLGVVGEELSTVSPASEK